MAIRLGLAGRIARQPILDALRGMPGIAVTAFDTIDTLVAQVADFDAWILSDPRGGEGAAIATALGRPDARVRWVQVVSAGYSGMLAHALPPGLVVTNQGGAVAPAVAEHALALILALLRRLPDACAAQRDQRWDNGPIRPLLRSLEGATVAIVGLGHVGRACATLLKPFGARRIGITRNGLPEPDVDEVRPLSHLDDVLRGTDIALLCLPDAPNTRHLFDTPRLAAIKAGSLLVNVGRGAVVDGDALIAALVSGHLGGAALDVTEPEPLPPGHPLWNAPNLLLTPHVAGGGNPLSGARIARVVAENALRFQRGEPLLNQVHPKVAS